MALLAVLLATLALARHASAQTPADEAPTNLTVTLTNGAVTLSWDAPAQDAASVTGYQVLRRRPNEGESAFQTLVADTMSTFTTYVDATADEEGVHYEYQLQALRGAAASAVSNSAELTLPFDICDRTQEVEAALLAAVAATDCARVPASQLAAITSLDLAAQSISSLQAHDFDGLTGLTTLDLEDNALTTLPAGLFSPLSALTMLDLRDNPGLSYSPYVLNPLTSLTTLDGAAYTRPSAPGAPTNLTASFQAGNIELNWTAPGTGAATSYQILRTAGTGDEDVYVEDSYDPDADAPSTAYSDAGVTEGETYEYRVRALNAGGASIESGAASVLAALVLSGPSAVSHPEESAFRVATFTAGPARPSLVWSLTGDDGDDFSIEGGVLRFTPAPTPMADYESPADDDSGQPVQRHGATRRAGRHQRDHERDRDRHRCGRRRDAHPLIHAPRARGGADRNAERPRRRRRHGGPHLGTLPEPELLGSHPGSGFQHVHAGGGGLGQVPAGRGELRRRARRGPRRPPPWPTRW